MRLDLSLHALDGHIVVVQVRGELDRPAAARLNDRLFSIPVPPAPRIILDLSGLDFIDAPGLRVLLACQLRARLRGGALALACPRRRCWESSRRPGWTGISPSARPSGKPSVPPATLGRLWPAAPARTTSST